LFNAESPAEYSLPGIIACWKFIDLQTHLALTMPETDSNRFPVINLLTATPCRKANVLRSGLSALRVIIF
jgi:hypothetical protein